MSPNCWKMAKVKSGKEGRKETAHVAKEEPSATNPIENLKLPTSLIILLMVVASALFWLLAPNDVTFAIFALFVLASITFLFITAITKFREFPKETQNLLPSIVGLMLLFIAFSYHDVLLSMLFTIYFVLSILLSSKIVRPQTVIILCLFVTAIFFRVYPALPGTGPAPGHLISMDDPYFHYKYTEDLYKNGNILDIDYRMYPDNPVPASKLFPYYYNTYLAFMTGMPLHHVMILYAVLLSAFAAVIIYFLLKELTGDWKSGFLGGFLFATLPILLTKSAAGATEEDPMGMVLGVFSLYLLVKAIKSEGSKSIKFAALAGVAFFITTLTWPSGVSFLYGAPFIALGLYALFSLVLKHNIWDTTRATIIAGAIPILGTSLLIKPGTLDLIQVIPYGFAIFFGVWAEVIRVRIWRGDDTKPELEKKYLFPFALLMTIAVIVVMFYFGPNNIVDLPNRVYTEFAGESSRNYLVDKTISEQGAFATGTLWEKLQRGLGSYGMGEALTLLMLFALPILIIYHFFAKQKERMFDLLLAYTFGLVFFVVAMTFVWVEARLGFSQSLGFIILGATAGLLLPKNAKELQSIKMVPFVLIVVFLLVFTFFSLPQLRDSGLGSAWAGSERPASVDPAWFLAVKWLDKHITPGYFTSNGYVNGDYVFTWWDYGHFITALSRATVITDPLQANEEYIMRTARFFYNKTSEDDAIKWLMEQPWNTKDANGEYKTKYIILDYTLIGKASALAFLGTNYYQYPNGQTAVNGVCQTGELCQNIENGLHANEVGGKYTCDQGIVCPRDSLVYSIENKKCCEENPIQCCNFSFDYSVIDNKGGSAKILRSPGSAVYDQYALTSGQVCRPEYTTSLEPIVVIENGVSKRAVQRYLYYLESGGMEYGDGVAYPAFIIFAYSDGTQKVKFISAKCETKDYEEVMSLGKDLLINLGYGKRLTKDAVAPQIFVHVPEKWLNAMFTQLYLLNAENLKYFKLVRDNETNEFYPSLKIYKVTYPGEISDIKTTGAKVGDVVEVDYTGRFENSTVFDTSAGKTPLKFTLGSGQLISGFEDAVAGMEVNESKTITIPPEKAYGFGDHPLANKTLVFDITLVSINKEEPQPAQGAADNATFDYYDQKLKESYNITRYPAVVWNCEFAKQATYSDLTVEEDALKKITCVVNKAEPTGICNQLGIRFDNATNRLTTSDSSLSGLLSTLKKIESSSPCAPGSNKALLQAFYTQNCSECDKQKSLLERLKNEFGSYIDLRYYCVGDETYCRSKSAVVIS